MKLYILITLFIFMCIFLSNTNEDYFGLVKEHFETTQSVPVTTTTRFDYDKSYAQSLNKIIQNKLLFVEYYIGRSDVDVEFDVKSRNTNYKKFISHLNVLMDTIIQFNNKKFRDLNDQYVRRYVTKFSRKREKDCIRYKVEVMLYNTKNYSSNPYLFEFCIRNNKFIINDIPIIPVLDGGETEEREPIVGYDKNPIIPFREEPVLIELTAPKKDYETDVEKPDKQPCDIIAPENKNYDWHPSYVQVDDIDHSYDFVTLKAELLV